MSEISNNEAEDDLPDILEEASDFDVMESEQPPEIHATEVTPGADVSLSDMEFVRRVFTQVKDVDFRSPPPPPPKGLSGPDKKLQDLRDKVRKLERELARIGFIWSNKSEEVEAVDKIVREKEAERATTVARYRQFKERAVQALSSHKEEIEALKAVVDTLNADKSRLEQTLAETQTDLSREQSDKSAMMSDFRAKMEAAQTAFAQLRDQSSRGMGNLEAQVTARDASLEELRGELRRTQDTLGQRDATLTQQAVTLSQQLATLAQRDASVAELEGWLAQRDKALLEVRADNEQRISETMRLQDELKQQTETAERHQAEVERLRAQPAPTPAPNSTPQG